MPAEKAVSKKETAFYIVKYDKLRLYRNN